MDKETFTLVIVWSVLCALMLIFVANNMKSQPGHTPPRSMKRIENGVHIIRAKDIICLKCHIDDRIYK